MRSLGEMQAMTPGSALALLEAPGPNGFMPSARGESWFRQSRQDTFKPFLYEGGDHVNNQI